MLLRKIIFTFVLLLLSATAFAQTFVGAGGGIGSMYFNIHESHPYKVPAEVPQAFICLETHIQNEAFFELDLSYSAKQTMEFGYTHYCGSPGGGSAFCSQEEDYDFIHYQMALLLNWRIDMSEKIGLLVGIGGLIKHNNINYTLSYPNYPIYSRIHFFTGSYAGFASHIGLNIKLSSHFELAPQFNYNYNFPSFNIHGYSNFGEIYFSLGLKYKVNKKPAPAPEIPSK